jgi:hypothetical protein
MMKDNGTNGSARFQILLANKEGGLTRKATKDKKTQKKKRFCVICNFVNFVVNPPSLFAGISSSVHVFRKHARGRVRT